MAAKLWDYGATRCGRPAISRNGTHHTGLNRGRFGWTFSARQSQIFFGGHVVSTTRIPNMKSLVTLCLPASIGGGSRCSVGGQMDGGFARHPRTWITRKVAK